MFLWLEYSNAQLFQHLNDNTGNLFLYYLHEVHVKKEWVAPVDTQRSDDWVKTKTKTNVQLSQAKQQYQEVKRLVKYLPIWGIFEVSYQNNTIPNFNINPTNTTDTIVINFNKIFNDGPAVSLKGSPTVSPITEALCASVPFPP